MIAGATYDKLDPFASLPVNTVCPAVATNSNVARVATDADDAAIQPDAV
jgi:hypothetical protein